MSKAEEPRLKSVDFIDRLPLSEQVYMTLKQAILTGMLKPNVKLNEVKIAEELSVSATPVREAFRKLAKDNLVVIKPWKGVTVKGYTAEEVVAMYQCREVMEGLGARLCASHCAEEQIEELEALCEVGIEEECAEKRVEINSRFHTLIALFSGNERVMDYLADFREMVNRDMYLSTLDKTRTLSCDVEHRHIVEAIRERNPQLAEDRMREHVRNAFVFKKAYAEMQGKTVEEML